MESFRIRAAEIDFKGELKVSALFQLMQEAAEHSAHQLGFGYDYVTRTNTFWVLSRVKLVIIRLPKWQETITVHTWPKGMNKMFAMRDYKIFDEKNNLLALATTAWLLLDGTTKRILRSTDFPADNGLSALDEFPAKIRADSSLKDVLHKTIRISELDINNHVNNARYVEWVMDALDYQLYKQRWIKELEINFVSESKFNDNVVIRRSPMINNNEIIMDAQNVTTGCDTVIARIKLSENYDAIEPRH